MCILPVNILKELAPLAGESMGAEIASLLLEQNKVVVVIDDDPTGAQYAGIPLLTEWAVQSITNEIERGTRLFFILTNTRSLTRQQAIAVNRQAGENIRKAFTQTNKNFLLISRSDSTLRGHYPQEVTALAAGLALTEYHTAILPAFFEAGRYTINDVQYVQEGDQLIPAHKTAFARDKAFGYIAGNLKEWVEEKSEGSVPTATVASFGINELRENKNIEEKLLQLPVNSTIIVNAVQSTDLEVFAKACLKTRVPVIFRSGPSFVAAIGSLSAQPLLTAAETLSAANKHGGLIVVGSYVPKTNAQLQHLLNTGIDSIELDVNRILNDAGGYLQTCVQTVERLLSLPKNVVVYTSRQLIHGANATESLSIGNAVSSFLVQLVKALSVQPKYIIAKGGITSHDIAVKALGIKRAVIKGQLAKGVPVWQTGNESLFRQMPYVVFPGNVGDERTLADLYELLA